MEIVWGPQRVIPRRVPQGDLVQEFVYDGEGCACAKTDSGYTIRFLGHSEFQIDAGMNTVVVHLGRDIDRRWAALLLGGSVLGLILLLAGKTVLHASAVEMNDRVLAFVGASGMGKSTLATLFCLRGHKLLTDDVLRIDAQKQSLVCFPGTASTRLRPDSATLAEHFSEAIRKESVDKRTCLQLEENFSTLPSLTAVMIPKLSRTISTARVNRLSPRAAILSLSSYPRIRGVKDRNILSSQFRSISRLAAMLPIYEAQIPWLDRLDPQLPEELLEDLRKVEENHEARSAL